MGERWVSGGVNGCVAVWQSGCGVFFQISNRLIQIVCQLLILHSAGGWCLVVGYCSALQAFAFKFNFMHFIFDILSVSCRLLF